MRYNNNNNSNKRAKRKKQQKKTHTILPHIIYISYFNGRTELLECFIRLIIDCRSLAHPQRATHQMMHTLLSFSLFLLLFSLLLMFSLIVWLQLLDFAYPRRTYEHLFYSHISTSILIVCVCLFSYVLCPTLLHCACPSLFHFDNMEFNYKHN